LLALAYDLVVGDFGMYGECFRILFGHDFSFSKFSWIYLFSRIFGALFLFLEFSKHVFHFPNIFYFYKFPEDWF
jgi:hypothetical protein